MLAHHSWWWCRNGGRRPPGCQCKQSCGVPLCYDPTSAAAWPPVPPVPDGPQASAVPGAPPRRTRCTARYGGGTAAVPGHGPRQAGRMGALAGLLLACLLAGWLAGLARRCTRVGADVHGEQLCRAPTCTSMPNLASPGGKSALAPLGAVSLSTRPAVPTGLPGCAVLPPAAHRSPRASTATASASTGTCPRSSRA